MKLILLLLLLTTSATVRAQFTPESYRDSVLRYSHSLRRSQLRVDAARENAAAARKGLLPRLDIEGDFSLSARHYSGREHWNFSLQPQIVQEIYSGGIRRSQRDAADIEHRIALLDADFEWLDVRYAADYAYWNLSAMNLYASAMRQYVALISSLKTIIDRRFAEGYISRGDVLMMDARLIEARYELTSAEQRAEVALHNFNTLMGGVPAQTVRLLRSISDSVSYPVRVSEEEMLAARPDYAAARLQVSLSEAGIRTARSAFNPRLSVGAGAVWKPYYPNTTGATLIDGVVFANLSVPIFHFRERRNRMGAARAAWREAGQGVAQLRDEAVRQEADAWSAIGESLSQVAISEESLRIGRESLEISTYAYNEGQSTLLEVLQAQLNWIQLYTNAIRAHFDHRVAVAGYERVAARR